MKKCKVFFVLMFMCLLQVPMHNTYAGSLKAGEVTDKKGEMKSQEDVSTLSGKVLETMDSGGYTYINMQKNGKSTWVAVPQTKVTVGQEISVAPGMVMPDFKSNTLNRTFDTIVFSSGIVGQESKVSGQKSSEGKQAEAKKIKVEKAAGPDAYTVAELHQKSATLDKKNIVLKGQVVKVSQAIMGKNWVHIQDGSGDSSNGSHNIVVTTQDLPSVGDIVTAQGTLFKDKDFGSGYKYAVIVEEASIKK
ncbi:MAG TPA: DNA-binding protein [Nitrospiraceae bacterium]|nr:DNA-binding protein [Nitrospiraceae bacterium]